MSAALELRGLGHSYGGVVALRGVSLSVADGELLAVLGPSGAGKTTLLRLIAGLAAPGAGEIDLGGAPASRPGALLLPPQRRRIGWVPQSLALWPHLSVAGHLEFPLRMAATRPAERERLVRETAAAAGLLELLDRCPAELSGGERQRVALARALAAQPRLLLLDEPLSAVDPAGRSALRAEIRALQRRYAIAAVYVTHDQVEAFELADRVLLLERGAPLQCAAPRELYERPATPEAAAFLGAVNSVDGRRQGGRLELEEGAVFPAPPGEDGPVRALLRPEDLEPGAAAAAPGWDVEVEARAFRGESLLLSARREGLRLQVAALPGFAGAQTRVTVRPGRLKVYPR